MSSESKAFVVAVILAAATSAAHAQQPPAAQLAQGERVYTYWCATCHSAGAGMPGTAALQAKYNGNPPAVLTERTELTAELITFFVRNGVSVMPFFRKTEISDADLAALAAYVVAKANGR